MIEVLACVGQCQSNCNQLDPLSYDYDHAIFERAFGKIVEGLGQCAIGKEKQIAA